MHSHREGSGIHASPAWLLQKCCHYTVLTATMDPKLSLPQGAPPASVASPAELAMRPGCFFSTAKPDAIDDGEQTPAGKANWEPMKPAGGGRQLTGRWGHTLVPLGGARLLCYGGFGTVGPGSRNAGKQTRLSDAELLEVVPVRTQNQPATNHFLSGLSVSNCVQANGGGDRLCYRTHLVPAAGRLPAARCGHAAAGGELGGEVISVVFGGRKVCLICPVSSFVRSLGYDESKVAISTEWALAFMLESCLQFDGCATLVDKSLFTEIFLSSSGGHPACSTPHLTQIVWCRHRDSRLTTHTCCCSAVLRAELRRCEGCGWR